MVSRGCKNFATKDGCDLILLRGDIAYFEAGYQALLNGAQNGRLPLELIDVADSDAKRGDWFIK